jgi:leucyl aminopeptidase
VDVSKEIAKELDLKIKILEEKDLKKIKAGGLLGVSKGSKEKPFLVILENKNKGKEISLIGKGITFDTGGLHIKIGDAMNEMHLDVSGAASVLASTLVIKKLDIPVNLITFIPLAENMISGESYRPGDILKTISGKTIEVGSPDAEGRIILADAIDYSKKFYKPNLIITLATLTGAAMVALGTKAAAIFSNNRDLERFFLETSEKTFDSLWPLPLWEDYKKDIEAPFADIWNIGKTRWGGAIHGAMFLYEFAKPNNFVHIDMAPRMTATEDDVLNKGSLGFGVYLFEKIFENYKDLYDLI